MVFKARDLNIQRATTVGSPTHTITTVTTVFTPLATRTKFAFATTTLEPLVLTTTLSPGLGAGAREQEKLVRISLVYQPAQESPVHQQNLPMDLLNHFQAQLSPYLRIALRMTFLQVIGPTT